MVVTAMSLAGLRSERAEGPHPTHSCLNLRESSNGVGEEAGKGSMEEKPKDFICFYRPDAGDSLWGDAGRGNPEAQAALGRLYLEGSPQRTSDIETEDAIVSSFTPAFEPDLSQATKWLQKAARQGHTEAKRLLGAILAKAKGVH